MNTSLLTADRVTLSAGGRRLLDTVSLRLQPGELHVLLGANGAGKSCLLRLLAGDRRPDSGEVRLDDRPLPRWPPRELARRRAVLPQGEALRFGFTVREVVSLGRIAARTGTPEQEAALIDEALCDADLAHLGGRRYPSLSGGERQRVQLARVLVQLATPAERKLDGRYLLLDEPTAALDLAHQHGCLEVARRKAREGAGVLAVLHDIHLAARFADRISLLHEGRLLTQGPPAQVLTPENLTRAYGASLRFRVRDGDGFRRIDVEGVDGGPPGDLHGMAEITARL